MRPSHSLRRRREPRGQAAVEAALVLPLALFLILGILQLALIQNARALTQYAAFNATRAGAVSYGSCETMVHSAVATLMPAIQPFTAGSPGSPGAGLAAAFQSRFTPGTPPVFRYTGTAIDDLANEDIVWVRRHRPLVGAVAAQALPLGQNAEFDDPDAPLRPNFRLETEVVFWFRLRIHFANWIMARLMLAHWGLLAYTEKNPIVNNGQSVDWSDDMKPPPFDALIAGELLARTTALHYMIPLRASYTMPMMTPVKARFFTQQDCPPTP